METLWSVQESSLYIVQVSVRGKTVTEIVMTASTSVIDMISNIGGTLGLFLGLSLLSAVEILYWACKSMSGIKSAKRGGKKGKKRKKKTTFTV